MLHPDPFLKMADRALAGGRAPVAAGAWTWAVFVLLLGAAALLRACEGGWP